MFMYYKDNIAFERAEEIYKSITGGDKKQSPRIDITFIKYMWKQCKKYRKILSAIDQNYVILNDIEELFKNFIDTGSDVIKIIIKCLSTNNIKDSLSIIAKGVKISSKLPITISQLRKFFNNMKEKQFMITFLNEKITVINKIINEIYNDENIIKHIDDKNKFNNIRNKVNNLSSDISKISDIVNTINKPITINKLILSVSRDTN